MCPQTADYLFLVADTRIQWQPDKQLDKYSVLFYEEWLPQKQRESSSFGCTTFCLRPVSCSQWSQWEMCRCLRCLTEYLPAMHMSFVPQRLHGSLPSKSSSRSAKVCWSCASMKTSSFSCLAAVISSFLLLIKRKKHIVCPAFLLCTVALKYALIAAPLAPLGFWNPFPKLWKIRSLRDSNHADTCAFRRDFSDAQAYSVCWWSKD